LTLIATEDQIDECFMSFFPLESFYGPDRASLDYDRVREEVANEAGVMATSLPRTRTLREVVGKLFLLLLDGSNDEYVCTGQLMKACDFYITIYGRITLDSTPLKACDFYMRGAMSNGDPLSTIGEELLDARGKRVPSAYDIVCDNIRYAGEAHEREAPEELDEQRLLLWLMNMFADCSEAEFVSGVSGQIPADCICCCVVQLTFVGIFPPVSGG